jgi:uncharacterized membrane protein YbhN (UPF0104 family)
MRRAIFGFGGILISAGAVLLLATTVDLRSALGVLANAQWPPLAVALLVIAVQLTIRAFRWRLLLPSRADGRRPATLHLVPVLLVGYLGNSVLPARLGELIRAYLVTRRERVLGAGALGSVVVERVIDVATLAVIAAMAAVLAAAPAWIVQGAAIAGGIGLAVLAVLMLGGVAWLAARLPASSARRFLESFAQFAGRQPPVTIAVAAALSCVAWGLDAAIFFLVGQSLGLGLGYPTALLIGAVTVLGTAIPSAPAYIGTFELAAVAAGGALGLPSDRALALAVASHAITSVPIAVAGALSLAGMSLGLSAVVRGGRELTAAPGSPEASE